jgi:uncharacterized lipoprotein YajG
MSTIKIATLITAIAMLAGCSSPQDKAAAAQEKIAKQRLDLVAKYQTCVTNAAGDQQKAAACDSYLKAADALR